MVMTTTVLAMTMVDLLLLIATKPALVTTIDVAAVFVIHAESAHLMPTKRD